MRIALIAAIAALVLAGGASARSEQGVYVFEEGEILTAAGMTPIDKVGDDVIRFTATASFSRGGMVVELQAPRGAWAEGTVTVMRRTDAGWRRMSTEGLQMSRADYRALASLVDAALDESDVLGQPQVSPEGETIVAELCTDGPGYLTERRVNGQNRWLSGFCGDARPNNEIARKLAGLLPWDRGRLIAEGF